MKVISLILTCLILARCVAKKTMECNLQKIDSLSVQPPSPVEVQLPAYSLEFIFDKIILWFLELIPNIL